MALEQGARWAKSLSTFHDHIPSQRYPAERGRYVLYVNFCCPWSHRTIIVHGLKKLGDIVQLVEADAQNAQHGWHFSGTRGPERDPVNGVKYIRELYFRADRHYTGRVTLPIMWDKVNSKPIAGSFPIFLSGFVIRFRFLVSAAIMLISD
jgi:putative glutathione S-transferase